MDKMTIYNAVRSVPQEAQKEFNNGRFKGTDINPMWRIKVLTEQFGPAGFGWYIDNVAFEDKVVAGETLTICQLDLFVKVGEEWSRPIHGVGGNRTSTKTASGNTMISDEAEKMAYTDAISVACKALGIGADVYYQADRTKYTAASVDAPEKAGKAAKTEAPAPASATGAKVCTKEMYDKYVEMEANGEKLKSGKTAKQGWIDTFHPSEADIKVFDLAVRKAFLEDLNG
jgi:hypothetical protein